MLCRDAKRRTNSGSISHAYAILTPQAVSWIVLARFFLVHFIVVSIFVFAFPESSVVFFASSLLLFAFRNPLIPEPVMFAFRVSLGGSGDA
jgi:hypothetical protein